VIPELDLHARRLRSGIEAQRTAAIRALQGLVGFAREERAPSAEPTAPPAGGVEPTAPRFRHPKFGLGVLVRREGQGPEAKLTVRFDSSEKTVLARFLEQVRG
jgi:hypothetical protein